MAYKQPSDKRDRTAEVPTSSYLEHFLEQVSDLPSTVLDTLDQIRKYDDRIDTLLLDAENSAAATVARSTSKGMPLENARRSYLDFIQFQRSATELSEKKVTLAENAYQTIDNVIVDIDRHLAEFESQLKREGRWLPPGKTPVTPRTPGSSAQPQDRSVVAKTPRSSQSAAESAKKPIVPTPSAQTRTSQKSRVRESTSGSARTSNKATKQPVVSSPKNDIVMEDVDPNKDAKGDPTDNSTVDTEVYCICRNVSHGEMICCDGKNCPYEWFHFECVGLTEAPKGSWLCDDCKKESAKARRKGAGARRKGGA